MPNPRIYFACITHTQPWTSLDPGIHVVGLGNFQPDDSISIDRIAPEWTPHHPMLGGTAGSFVVRRIIEKEDVTHVCILQYRKFLSPTPLGRPSKSYPVINVLDLHEINSHITTDILGGEQFLSEKSSTNCLICEPIYFRNRITYLEQYEQCHHVEDIIDFARAAVEVGALLDSEVEFFLTEQEFIPAGMELGILPKKLWCRTIELVERIIMLRISRGPPRRVEYQARHFSFCSERLTSYLLLKELRAGRVEPHFGKIITLLKADQLDYIGGA